MGAYRVASTNSRENWNLMINLVPVANGGTGQTSLANVTGVGSANKLAAARNIGGVPFDGTADINLPGVNAAGNQNTSGSAAKLTTGRTIALTGDVTGTSAAFDGSGNVSFAATLANTAVVAARSGETANKTLTFGGTFAVHDATVDAKGRLTALTARTMTMPANPVRKVSISIPTSAWVASTTYAGYVRQAAVTVSGLLATEDATVKLDITSIIVAETAGLMRGGVTAAGTLTLYARQNPTAALNGVVVIM